MTDYRQLYLKLFNAMTDALQALERRDGTLAQQILIKAQQDAEEAYISDGE